MEAWEHSPRMTFEQRTPGSIGAVGQSGERCSRQREQEAQRLWNVQETAKSHYASVEMSKECVLMCAETEEHCHESLSAFHYDIYSHGNKLHLTCVPLPNLFLWASQSDENAWKHILSYSQSNSRV